MPSKSPLANLYTKLYNCLGFLENPILRTVLIIVLVVYNSSLINVVNVEVSKVLNMPVVKLLFVVVVVMFAIRDPVLAILLAMALVISVCTKHNVEGMENPDEDMKNKTHMEGQHMEGQHMKGQHMEGQHMEGQQMKGQHMEGQKHMEGQHMGSQQPMEGGKPMEGFDNPVEQGVAQGYNVHPDCVSGLCDENKERSELCNSVKTFQNSQNAQGMNCPQGYDGKAPGSPW